jgi:hypothetical protein
MIALSIRSQKGSGWAVMPEDLIILLSAAIPLSLPRMADHSNNMPIRRWHRKIQYYHGTAPARDQCRALCFLEGPEHNLPVAPWLDEYAGFPDLVATTGFWVWMLLRDGFLGTQDNLFLVNFVGSRD